MARLARIRDVARAREREAVVARVDEMVDLEVARHAEAMRDFGLDADLEEGL
jgi:hypothetical protein